MAKIYKIALIFLFFGLLSSAADAATLHFSPSSGEYAVGKTLSVGVYAESADQAMNAASGIISFPQDKLEVTSLSKTGSIFTLWVQEPSFSNSAGTVNFEGIVLNPGFTGATGKAIIINFRVKAAGVALVNFSSGSALANDGQGTNILTSLGNARFSLGGAASTIPESTTPSAVFGAPFAPQISSPTHPDPNKWYAQKDAKFTWSTPVDTTGVRLLVGKIPSAIPAVTYIPAINEKEVANFTDGIWYFHVQLRNASGWGEISHFRFQIDTEKPIRFDISEIPRTDPTEPKARFIFDAKDDTSSIDYYEIQIDGGSPEKWNDDGSHRYETAVLEPGKHILIAKAVDKAGNSLANSAELTIEALNPPAITDYPRELQSGEPLIVRGSTYSDSKVTIWLQREKDDPKSFIVESGRDGKFTFGADERLRDGIYRLWAEVVDDRGTKSLPTEKIIIAVARPAIFRVGSWVVSFLAVIVPLAVLVFAFLFILWHGWHKFSLLRKRIRKEVREAEFSLHKAFDLLKENVRGQIKILEKTRTKRQLTEEEEKIVKQLKRDLDDAERFIRKEIEDIEKEVK